MTPLNVFGKYKADKEYEKIHTLFLRDEYEEAEKEGVALLKKYPDHEKTMMLLAQIAWNQEHYQRSWERYNKLVTVRSGNKDARIGRAHALYQLYKFEDALDDYLTLYETSFNNTDYLIALGDTYQKLNLHVIALRYYQKAVKQAPRNIKAHLGIGYEYVILGYYKEAKHHAELAKDLYYKEKHKYEKSVSENIFELEEQVNMLTREPEEKMEKKSKRKVRKRK